MITYEAVWTAGEAVTPHGVRKVAAVGSVILSVIWKKSMKMTRLQ